MDRVKHISAFTSRVLLVAFLLLLLTGCSFRQWMYNQPKAYGLRGSEFFEDSRSARPVVPGTVAVGEARTDDFFYTGLIDGQAVDQVPIEITAEVLEQGQQQYEIYCAPCHGISGYGNGMVARRGGTPPANYHSDYQLNQPISHYFVVATNGYRNMWSYEQKISAEDRWAIAVYIRALQVSQNAPETLVPEEELTRLQQPESNTQEEQGTDQ